MAKILSVINNKGGTAKTTTALNLGAALAKLGHRVLLVDMDSQCNLSLACGITNPELHIGNLILRQNEVDEVLVKLDTIAVIPSTENLLDYELQINSEPGRDYLLKESFKKYSGEYEYVIVDCPPSLGALAINSLVAADFYIVPMQAENFAFVGLDTILHTAEKVKLRMNAALELAGILLVRFASRTKFAQAVVSNIKEDEGLEGKLFDTVIRQDIALMESTAFNQNIFEYAPRSRGAVDYLNFAKEIVEKYGRK